jgi:hypothetical protein
MEHSTTTTTTDNKAVAGSETESSHEEEAENNPSDNEIHAIDEEIAAIQSRFMNTTSSTPSFPSESNPEQTEQVLLTPVPICYNSYFCSIRY